NRGASNRGDGIVGVPIGSSLAPLGRAFSAFLSEFTFDFVGKAFVLGQNTGSVRPGNSPAGGGERDRENEKHVALTK
ncbi:MAG: hypothetical protein KDA99_12645, partial [Planctomycetales bacterium]|nr:hypothetical protein [Planctomycetales bacterium]